MGTVPAEVSVTPAATAPEAVAPAIDRFHDAASLPTLVLARGGRLRRCDQAAAALLGLGADERDVALDPARLPESLGSIGDWADGVIDSGEPMLVAVTLGERHYVLQLRAHASGRAATAAAVFIDQSALLRIETQLEESNRKFHAILESSPAMVALKGVDGRYRYVNPRFAQFFGREVGDCIGRCDDELLSPELAADFAAAERSVLGGASSVESEHAVLLPQGRHQWLAVRFPLHDESGRISAICLQATDITARKQMEFDLRLSAAVFEQAQGGIVITDSRRLVVSANPAFALISGHAAAAIEGREPLHLLADDDEEVTEQIWRAVEETGGWHGELRCRRPTGELYPAWLDVVPTRDDGDAVISHVINVTDLSPIRESRQRVEFLATHDVLTELPNRRLFADRFDQAARRARRQKSRLAVLVVDLDNFKYVNDSMGHEFGDALLSAVSAILRNTLRDTDTVARTGGDEFAILLEKIGNDDATLAAQRLLDAVRKPVSVLGEPVHVGLSIGITIYPEDGTELSQLMANADAAMYRAKAAGRNTFHFFSTELRQELQRRMVIDRELRVAVPDGQLFMVYQPQYRLADGRITALEALLRWRHPQHGDLTPDQFVPIAEDSVLIDQITHWAISEVVRQVRAWTDAGIDPPTVSLNVATRNFRRMDLAGLILSATREHGVDPRKLSLEFTEKAVMEGLPRTRQRLDALQRLGIGMCLDDFGSGYSSISTLSQFPIQSVKFDLSLSRKVLGDGREQALIAGIHMIAQALDLEIIAEGIESAEQARKLAAIGIRVGQGYHFGRVLSADEIAALLRSTGHAPALPEPALA